MNSRTVTSYQCHAYLKATIINNNKEKHIINIIKMLKKSGPLRFPLFKHFRARSITRNHGCNDFMDINIELFPSMPQLCGLLLLFGLITLAEITFYVLNTVPLAILKLETVV